MLKLMLATVLRTEAGVRNTSNQDEGCQQYRSLEMHCTCPQRESGQQCVCVYD